MIYAITYDLRKVGQDYSALYNKIRSLGNAYWALQNLWFLDSTYGVNEIRDLLHSVVDSNDSVFVTKIRTSEYGAWMSQDAHDWLDQRL